MKTTLIGSHPIREYREDAEEMENTLRELVSMKFIHQVDNVDDNIPTTDITQQSTLKSLTFGASSASDALPHNAGSAGGIVSKAAAMMQHQSSMLRMEHGQLDNHYANPLIHHHDKMDLANNIKGRYGSTMNNVVNRNRMPRDSVSEVVGLSGLTGHLRHSSQQSVSSDLAQTLRSNGADLDDEEVMKTTVKNDENSEKFGNNMPLTSSLVRAPIHKVPWKIGKLEKIGGVLSTWQERTFVFKGRSLYWFKNQNVNKYPLGRYENVCLCVCVWWRMWCGDRECHDLETWFGSQ